MEYQEAFNATNPDPSAYGIPPDTPDRDERLRKAREQAALNLLAGTVANQTYWDSRTELDALRAQAEGHGGIGVPPDQPQQPADAEVVEAPESAGELGTGADTETGAETRTETGAEPAAGAGLAPTPDNPVEAVSKLRAQLEAAGITPEV